MWEQIATLSEIDTVKAGTLLAKENPLGNADPEIYRVTGRTEDNISINPKVNNRPDTSIIIQYDTLFNEGWWMLKEE